MKINFSNMMSLLALRYGDKEALVNTERNRRYTYRELHICTNKIANMMRDTLKLRTNDKALMILENDNLSLMHFLSSWKQEATAVYTNFRDSLDEHTWQVALVKPRVVFIESSYVERYHAMLREHNCTIVAMDPLDSSISETIRQDVLDFWTLVNAASPDNNDCELDIHNHTPMLRFTGGTTGRGKCAMYTIDGMLGTRDGMLIHPDLAINEEMRFLHFAPLSHGTLMFFIPAPFVGATTFTQNQPDLHQWRKVAESESITHSFLVPTLLYRLLDLQNTEPKDLTSLTTLVYGAAPMSPARLSDLVNAFGPVFVQIYGATEAAMTVSLLSKKDHKSENAKLNNRLGSAGCVAPGVEINVVDESGNPLPTGEIGEIVIRCRAVIAGYYENPEGTASEFQNGAWKSGDLGYLDEDGFLFIVDRKKDMIISGGFNIYAIEVEAALGSHPAVQMSAVVGVPHDDWGEAVHAEVILRPGCKASEAELISHVKSKIGSYKAPKTVSIVQELPVSAVGKVIRRRVKEKYWEGRSRAVG